MTETASAWIFEAVPKEWDVNRYLRDVSRRDVEGEMAWPVTAHVEDVKAGDRVFVWRAGDHKVAGVVALARVVDAPAELEEDKSEYRKAAFEDKYAAPQPRARIHIESVLSKPLYGVKLEWTEATKGLAILGEKPGGAVYRVDAAQAEALERLCEPLAQTPA